MDPIPVREEDYEALWNLQKSIQQATLANDTDRAAELDKEMTDKIYELYPQCVGRKVRFDVSAKKIFIWG
jgi:propanediol dehydratase small subunit